MFSRKTVKVICSDHRRPDAKADSESGVSHDQHQRRPLVPGRAVGTGCAVLARSPPPSAPAPWWTHSCPRKQGHLSLRSSSARNLGRWQEPLGKTCLSTIGTSALRGGPFAPASMALGSQSKAELMHGPLVRTRGSAGWTGSYGHLGTTRGAPKQVASFAEGSPLWDGRS